MAYAQTVTTDLGGRGYLFGQCGLLHEKFIGLVTYLGRWIGNLHGQCWIGRRNVAGKLREGLGIELGRHDDPFEPNTRARRSHMAS